MFHKIDKIYALLMGNSMESCKEDVNRMENLLSVYDPVIEKYINCNTQIRLLNFCNSYKFNINDLLIIHYSGHGRIIGKKIDNKMEVISSWVNGDNSLTHSYNIDNILNQINCSKILISDSCHSGNFSNFYKATSPFLFIGSSSIINLSNEYNIFHREKTGVLVCLFEYIFKFNSLRELNLTDFKEITSSFIKKYKIKVKPVIKTYNI